MTENIADMSYYAQALAVLWPVKTALAAVAAWFGTEPGLIYWLAGAWALDWLFGICEAILRGQLSCRVFKRGALKIPSYGLCIILVYGTDTCIELACHVSIPLFDCFIAYLAIQESASVLGHAKRLGFQIPPLVQRILKRLQAKMEQKVDNLLDDDRRTPGDGQ